MPQVRTNTAGTTGAEEKLAAQARRIERLEKLVEAAKALNSTLDLGELFGIILGIATQNTGADRASLFLVDTESNELWTLVAQGLGQQEIRLPAGKGLAGWVAQSGQHLNLADAYADERFDQSFDMGSGYRTRTVLVMPVRDRNGRTVAVLQLLNKADGGFSQDDIDFVDGISVNAALALENARLHRESLQRQRMERDLAVAREIQRGLLPEGPPRIEGFDVAVHHETSLQVGGDYYDFIALSGGVHVFLVADVEGKGPAAALVMSNLQASLHALVRHVHSIEGIMYHLNERILEGTRGGKYLTMFIGLLDAPRRGLHYVNAGHVTPVVIGAQGTQYLREGGMPIGILPRSRYKRGFLPLQSGDVVLTCTDGITEADNPEEEQFGLGRLVACATAHRGESAAEIVKAVFAEVGRFAKGGQHQDDEVLMAVKML